MTVTNVETFKLSGGVLSGSAALTAVVATLTDAGISSTTSGSVLTITNSSLSGTIGSQKFAQLIRIAKAGGMELTYVAAT
jgi:hypothetical protein